MGLACAFVFARAYLVGHSYWGRRGVIGTGEVIGAEGVPRAGGEVTGAGRGITGAGGAAAAKGRGIHEANR
jgi:hypothetical protein